MYVANGAISSNNLMSSGNKKCSSENNSKFYYGPQKILSEEIVESIVDNNKNVCEINNVPSQHFSNEMHQTDSKSYFNECKEKHVLSKEINNLDENMSNGKCKYVNKLSIFENEEFISNEREKVFVNKSFRNNKTSALIQSQYFMQYDSQLNSESSCSSDRSKNGGQIGEISLYNLQNPSDMKTNEMIKSTEEHFSVDSVSVTSKEADIAIVSMENAIDISPVLTVSAENFASFEEVCDNIRNQNSQSISEKFIPSYNNNDNNFQELLFDKTITDFNNYIDFEFCHDINSQEMEKSNLETSDKVIKTSQDLLHEVKENGRISMSAQVNYEELKESQYQILGIESDDFPAQKKSFNLSSVQESNMDNVNVLANNVSSVKVPVKDLFLNHDLTPQSSISPSPKNPIHTIGMDGTEYSNENFLITQSSLSLSPKSPILTIGMDELENSNENDILIQSTLYRSPKNSIHTIGMDESKNCKENNCITQSSISLSPKNPIHDIGMDETEHSNEYNLITQSRISHSPKKSICTIGMVETEQSNEKDLITQSSISLSPKNPIRTIGMDETENSNEIINDKYMPVNMETESNIMEEYSTGLVEKKTNLILLDELSGSRTSFSNTDSISDNFHKHNDAPSSSFISQTFTEDAMDCSYNETRTETNFLQNSPLLFNSDDENTYYTGE
ncbi:hypothetical protein L9F63_021566 [Diploptera punctata]|uniref:Uncharacterized protein n=1 Tax=Diploptera punctata TaxID=6984 RepID=A0AAD7ZNM5_DIPPU|nr:hypothetical protein L9F63_021566 [Diploptera punctata]